MIPWVRGRGRLDRDGAIVNVLVGADLDEEPYLRQAGPWEQRTIQAVGVSPATPGVSVLIGRDILDHCRFVFDGAKGRYTLWF